jgi:xanthine/CO dehydrogenase XdhC/CoxF family maturation factor
VTLIDHRPAMLSSQNWAEVERILLRSSGDATSAVERVAPDAAVVMSHNYERDLVQLGALLTAGIPYIGVLGPRRRTRRMLDDLKANEADVAGLYAPVGLDIGAETPEEIALAIVAEVQAVSADRLGAPLRERPGAIHDEFLALETAGRQ